jgi:poly-gamma-glutamate synthesis protein (capsule biosynthesis protein)
MTGSHLRMLSDTNMPYLHQLKIDAVTMANNHILDYGYKGVKDTFKELVDHKIKYIGAGNDLTEARKPLSLHKDGMKIAILNFCENEWSIAEDDSPGANPMDVIDNTNQIREAKASLDNVMSIYCVMSSANSWSESMQNSARRKNHHYAILKMWTDFDHWNEKKYHRFVVKKNEKQVELL